MNVSVWKKTFGYINNQIFQKKKYYIGCSIPCRSFIFWILQRILNTFHAQRPISTFNQFGNIKCFQIYCRNQRFELKLFYFTNSIQYTQKLISNTDNFLIIENKQKNIIVNVGNFQNACCERPGNMLIWCRIVF